jgi:hypothetical protein
VQPLTENYTLLLVAFAFLHLDPNPKQASMEVDFVLMDGPEDGMGGAVDDVEGMDSYAVNIRGT